MNRLVKLLLCVCVFAVVFSDGRAGVASDGSVRITASEVTDEGSLKRFVEYAAERLQSSGSFTEVLDLLYDFREVGGDWNHGSTYLILLTSNGGVYVHARNRELEDQDWSNLQDAKGTEVGKAFLKQDGGFVDFYGSQGAAVSESSYALPFAAPLVPFANPFQAEEKGFVLVGGFDYEPEPEGFGGAEVPCEDFFASYDLPGAICPTVDASDVVTLDDLKVFLDNARHFFTAALVSPEIDPVVLRRIFRIEDGPWRHGATYVWIQSEMGRAIFNGVNRDLEQRNLWEEEDEDGDRYVQELIAAAGTGQAIEYNWENPLVAGDGEGGGPGGSSLKLGYVIKIPIPLEGETKGNTKRVYIFGSGIYLGDQSGQPSDRGGCMVAGVGDTVRNGLLSLFLMISVLFLAVSLRRYSV